MRLFFSLMFTSILMITSIKIKAEELTLSTWNTEWLTVNLNHKIDEARRKPEDFSALKSYFHKLDADLIAFQEVDNQAAFKQISSSNYKILLSDRNLPHNRNHQFPDINQFTGFAIRNNIPFSDPVDIDLYGKTNHKLRFAAYVILYPESRTPIHALSIHLKAGCMGKFYSNKKACQTLLEQGENLNQWIKQRESQGDEYIIMGDFNHNLSYGGDWLWKEMTQGIKQTPKLATRDTQAECKVPKRNNPKQLHQFRSVIDHIIVSSNLSVFNAKQAVYDEQDVLNYRLSDHCPVTAQLKW